MFILREIANFFPEMFKNMYFFSLFFLGIRHLILVEARCSNPYHTADDIAINCGYIGNSIALDGREWVGDAEPQFSRTPKENSKAVSSKAPKPFYADTVPYMTARISRSEFTYSFQVNQGQKFIRLHFHPAFYQGYERSKAFFTVKAGPYILLENFSASLYTDASGLISFTREFCLHIEESQVLSLTFSPSKSSSCTDVYAFVNGIEIISMPTGLYYTPDGDLGARVVGQKHWFHVDHSTALELVHRLNVGGGSILPVDDCMFRKWLRDSRYLSESGILPLTTAIPIKYKSMPTYIAPPKVYQTSWSTDPNKQRDKMNNLTWYLPVDVGFRYLVRIHLCELDHGIKDIGQRKFGIFIDSKTAEASADLIEMGGENAVAVYRDYVVMMEGNRREGKRDLNISLQPQYYDSRTKFYIGASLSGIEVFKLSNPDYNLAVQNPEPGAHTPADLTMNFKGFLRLSGSLNSVVRSPVLLMIFFSIIVYNLRLWAENLGQKDVSASSIIKKACREFSFPEIQLATNNFDDALVIGDGGFGKVYKGIIDKGTTTVAVKRLKTISKQGAEEFWTEIKLLSNLRHTHLVTLVGYCNDVNEMILVYEYMINGTLADHLHKMRGNDVISSLSWEQRLNICIGAARGLEYLHTGAEHRVIHRDVKTSNILLDENWVAKISDFGLSKMGGLAATNQASTYIITDVKGTFGYLDVEYFLTHRLTRKSDVYAFGVVLFEALCGRPAVDKRYEGEERSLSLWVQCCIKEGTLDRIIDRKIKKEISPHCLKVFVDVAHKCLCNRPKDRPRMSDVVQRLEFALASQDQKAYSSTETEGDEEVEEKEATNVSMLVNMSIENIVEEEEEEEERVVDTERVHQSMSDEIGELSTTEETKSSTDKSMDKAKKKTKTKGFVFWRRSENVSPSSSSSSWWKWNRSVTATKVVMPSLANSSPVIPSLAKSSLPESVCRRFSLTEIKAATKNFRPNLVFNFGAPGGSEMYKGYIDNGKVQVAIERCVRQSKEEFVGEIGIRSRINHPNIVSFFGYCHDLDEAILVHEFMVKGSLKHHLHGEHVDPLPWQKRLEISINAAQGLRYLHTSSLTPIIHGEFKSSRILLDDKWIAKISSLKAPNIEADDKATTRTVVTTVFKETFGYMDPEYLLCGNLTTKSDVYSFGVVLLELLSSKKPQRPHLRGDEKNLVHLFKSCIQKKTIGRILDPYLVGKMSPESLRKFVKIAESCLLFRGVERPKMDAVLEELYLALQMQKTSGQNMMFGSLNSLPEEAGFNAAIRAYTKILDHGETNKQTRRAQMKKSRNSEKSELRSLGPKLGSHTRDRDNGETNKQTGKPEMKLREILKN